VGLLHSPIGAVGAAVAALLTAVVVGVGLELVPVREIADQLRFGDPISATIVSDPPEAGVPGAATNVTLAGDADQREITNLRPPLPSKVRGAPLVPVGWMAVLVELRGRRSEPVDVLNAHVRVLRCQPPLTGTFLLGPGPQGSEESLVLSTTVDDLAPRLLGAGDGQPYFPGHRLTLARDETVAMTIEERSTRSYCEWDLALDYVTNGHRGTAYVGSGGVVSGSHDGQPFTITARPPRIERYGAVYGIDTSLTSEFRYERLTRDRYCSVVRVLYRSTFDDWAC